MAIKPAVALALSLDVEEEGLFRGSYACAAPTIRNIWELDRLKPLLDMGLKATLFCAHCAFSNLQAQRMLEKMRDAHGVEIGAHLHHWNTPPLGPALDNSCVLDKVLASDVPLDNLAAKMETLLGAAKQFQGEPVRVFRMGRWDIHRTHWPILKNLGIRYDASVRPLHAFAEGPDHFDAPPDPYKIEIEGNTIAEIPLTSVPLVRSLAKFPRFRENLRNWGALTLLPVEHPLWLMKLTTQLHVARGGKTLSLTWHSSEMMPGGSPHLKDNAAIYRFLAKISAYVDWLNETYDMEYLTISKMGQKYALNCPKGETLADWTYQKIDHVEPGNERFDNE